MRKILSVITLCLLVLCGCSSVKSIEGTVVEMIPEAENCVQFLMETPWNRQAIVCFDEETLVHSWVEGVDIDKFKQGEMMPAEIRVFYEKNEKTKLDALEEIDVYMAKEIGILGVPVKKTYILTDGTSLELWQTSNGAEYHLEDGTTLAREEFLSGPENSYLQGVDSFEQLPVTAREEISKYYEEQGLLYDLSAELEKAYASYQENPEDFSTWSFSQDSCPSASNENIIAFLTTVRISQGETYEEKRSCAVFDKTTGEKINVYDLFVFEKEEVAEEILKAARMKPETLFEEMKQAFRTEYIIFTADSLQISFPAGTLPSQEYEYIIHIDQDLEKLLHEWAIPVVKN